MMVELGEHQGIEPLETLNALAREARDGLVDPSPAERSDGWAGVATRRRRQARRRALVSTAGALAAAVVVLALIPGLRFRPRSEPASTLTYQVQGGSVVEGGYLRESGNDGIRLGFAEGTDVSFNPGTRGRLRSVSSMGAKVAIEHGKARFNVIARPQADWSVEVGPFLVAVKGTTFTVAWDPVTEHFDLALEKGVVSVTGPISSGTVLLKTGQRMAVDLPNKRTIITEADADVPRMPGAGQPSAGSMVESRPAGIQPLPASSRGDRTAPQSMAVARRGWAQAVGAGDWDRILADVDRVGVTKTLAQASSDDLLALADAARYRRRNDLAQAALLADRRRFPGSPSALEAAYLLGRLSESGRGSISEAIRWYDTYLAGAPVGPYASDALGRKMMATNRLDGAAATAVLAQEYLRRFPSGSYASAARALLDSSP